jgi:hypothetical protein
MVLRTPLEGYTIYNLNKDILNLNRTEDTVVDRKAMVLRTPGRCTTSSKDILNLNRTEDTVL